MVTVIRQHIEGYVGFLMYSDSTSCVMSYCKKNKTMKVTFRSDYGTSHLNYDNLDNNLISSIMDMITLHMSGNDMSKFGRDELKITNLCIKAIRKHVNRRVIKSLVKPYFKLSNFNPKNRRVIPSIYTDWLNNLKSGKFKQAAKYLKPISAK